MFQGGRHGTLIKHARCVVHGCHAFRWDEVTVDRRQANCKNYKSFALLLLGLFIVRVIQPLEYSVHLTQHTLLTGGEVQRPLLVFARLLKLLIFIYQIVVGATLIFVLEAHLTAEACLEELVSQLLVLLALVLQADGLKVHSRVLQHGVELDEVGEAGARRLIMAARNDHVQVLILLINDIFSRHAQHVAAVFD